MGIINRRNAVFGWSVWQVVKRMGKRKAKDAVPGTGDHAGLNKSAIATIVAAVGGALFFWRKKSDGETTTS
jgi:ABC-type Co2+ transport system permease subunit